MDTSSNGLEIAASAAVVPLLLPRPTPIPTKAIPASLITALTSAKSRLINPGIVIKSAIACTDCLNTVSVISKASLTEVSLLIILSNRSFEIVIKASTVFFSSSIPCSAWIILFFPSKLKGRVTTPIVSAPSLLAISATTGAAPLPVPPPIPAVIKTILASSKTLEIKFLSSSAAFLPISGSPPAPKPRVVNFPIWTF